MYQKPKGTADILPGVSEKWQYIEQIAQQVFKEYRYQEIRTPLFEHYEVIARSVGDTTDIVSKEMYDFHDKGNRHITLRPEGTAPIARAYVENKLYGPEYQKPYKVFYSGPMYRYERPQSGRQREFHQIGIEAFGSENPALDVEVMALALEYFNRLGIKHLKLVINSLGDKETRDNYRQALIDYLTPHFDELSEDSQKRLHHNPLRVLDSKDPRDKKFVESAPSIIEYLNESSSAHFKEVKALLEALEIEYTVDSSMVRGLDYYHHTIFEIMSDAPGFGGVLTTVCAGGRYDKLVEELGGPATPSVGFALGVERLLITLEAENIQLPISTGVDAYVVGIGDETNMQCMKVVQTLRHNGISAERDYNYRKPKAQFKSANKLSAKLVFTLGETELANGTINVKQMSTGKEKILQLKDIYEQFEKVIAPLFVE